MDGIGWFVILWLFLLTVLIIVFGVLLSLNKIDFGPTGPTGPAGPTQGMTGPTGPTGPASGNIGLISSSNINLSNNVALGNVTPLQLIEGGSSPQIVKFTLTTTSFIYDGSGTFTLTPGTYSINTTVVYNNTNNNNTKSLAIWLRDTDTNIVSTSDLLDSPSIINMPPAISLTKNITFNVTTKNKLSVLTWHDGTTMESITNISTIMLTKL
jgi:hypothetical protein